jgi:acetyl-CoA synthetase
MLKPAATYDDLIARFRWLIPERYNIAASCCDAWAEISPDRVTAPLGSADMETDDENV